MTKGAELHHISLTSRTPLLGLLDSILVLSPRREDLSFRLFDHWLQDLAECDVDLEEYGRTETSLHERGLVIWNFKGDFVFPDESKVEVLWTMKELCYGESPRDWGFYIEADVYTSDESLEYNMPGAWTDEQSMSEEEEGLGEDYGRARIAGDEEEESVEMIEDNGRLEARLSGEERSVGEQIERSEIWERSEIPGDEDPRDEHLQRAGKHIVRTEIFDKSPVGSSPGAGEYICVFPCDPLDYTKYEKFIVRHW